MMYIGRPSGSQYSPIIISDGEDESIITMHAHTNPNQGVTPPDEAPLCPEEWVAQMAGEDVKGVLQDNQMSYLPTRPVSYANSYGDTGLNPSTKRKRDEQYVTPGVFSNPAGPQESRAESKKARKRRRKLEREQATRLESLRQLPSVQPFPSLIPYSAPIPLPHRGRVGDVLDTHGSQGPFLQPSNVQRFSHSGLPQRPSTQDLPTRPYFEEFSRNSLSTARNGNSDGPSRPAVTRQTVNTTTYITTPPTTGVKRTSKRFPQYESIGVSLAPDSSSRDGFFEYLSPSGKPPYSPDPKRTLVMQHIPHILRNEKFVTLWCRTLCGVPPRHVEVNLDKALIEFQTKDMANLAFNSPRLQGKSGRHLQVNSGPDSSLIRVWWLRLDPVQTAPEAEMEEGEIEEVEVEVPRPPPAGRILLEQPSHIPPTSVGDLPPTSKKQRKAQRRRERAAEAQRPPDLREPSATVRVGRSIFPLPHPLPYLRPKGPGPSIPDNSLQPITPSNTHPNPTSPTHHRTPSSPSHLENTPTARIAYFNNNSPSSQFHASPKSQPVLAPAQPQAVRDNHGSTSIASSQSKPLSPDNMAYSNLNDSGEDAPLQLPSSPLQTVRPRNGHLSPVGNRVGVVSLSNRAEIFVPLQSPIRIAQSTQRPGIPPTSTGLPVRPAFPFQEPMSGTRFRAHTPANGAASVPRIQKPPITEVISPKQSLIARQNELKEQIMRSKADISTLIASKGAVNKDSSRATLEAIAAQGSSDASEKTVSEDSLRRLVPDSSGKAARSVENLAPISLPLIDDNRLRQSQPRTAADQDLNLAMLSTSSSTDESRDSSPPAGSPVSSFTSASLDSAIPRDDLGDLAISFITEAIQTVKPIPREPTKHELLTKQRKLEQYIAEGKELMNKLSLARNKLERDRILAIMRERSRTMEEDTKSSDQTIRPTPGPSTGLRPTLRSMQTWPGSSEDVGILVVSDDEE